MPWLPPLFSTKDAEYAWRKMDGLTLDGRKWKVDWWVGLDRSYVHTHTCSVVDEAGSSSLCAPPPSVGFPISVFTRVSWLPHFLAGPSRPTSSCSAGSGLRMTTVLRPANTTPRPAPRPAPRLAAAHDLPTLLTRTRAPPRPAATEAQAEE